MADKVYPDIALVDENDVVIGQIQWSDAQGKPVYLRVASVYIHDNEGSLLMQKRSEYVAYPGKWNQSAAGHVDVGESYEECAVRELKEETGLEGIELEQFHYHKTDFEVGGKFFTHYLGVYKGEIVDFDEHESEAFEWWSFDEVLRRITDEPDIFLGNFRQVAPIAIEAIRSNVQV